MRGRERKRERERKKERGGRKRGIDGEMMRWRDGEREREGKSDICKKGERERGREEEMER